MNKFESESPADFLRNVRSGQNYDYDDCDGGNSSSASNTTTTDIGIGSYQLICIPNDDIRSHPGIIEKSNENRNGTIMSHLQSETDYWHLALGFDHANRLPIIR